MHVYDVSDHTVHCVCSAYGDAVFLLIQTAAIAFLVLYYGGNPGGAVVYTAVLAGAVGILLSPAVPLKLLWTMQASVMFTVIFARVGIYSTWQNMWQN